MNISGIPLHISKYLCTKTQVQAKKHKRNRINKKWRKRYGLKQGKCPGVSYLIYSEIIVCPCLFERIKKQVPLA